MKFFAIISFFLAATALATTTEQQQEFCWKICFPEQYSCPEGWVSQLLARIVR
jgi:hypothetical protein